METAAYVKYMRIIDGMCAYLNLCEIGTIDFDSSTFAEFENAIFMLRREHPGRI